MMGEKKPAIHLFQLRFQPGQIAVENDRLAVRGEKQP